MGQLKKFTKNAIVFLVILIVFILLTNVVYSKLIYEKKRVYKLEKMYQDYKNNLSTKEVDYAFFGTSHTVDGLNPEYILGSYNFAVPAGNYFESYFILKRVVDQDKIKIKNILLEFDMSTFSTTFERVDDISYFAKFTPYSSIVNTFGTSIIDYIPLWINANFPFIGDGIDFKILISDPNPTIQKMGWVKMEPFFYKQENKTFWVMGTYRLHYEKTQRISDSSFQYFLKTIEFARDHNINIFLIKYPMTKEYEDVIIQYNVDKTNYYNTLLDGVHSKIGNNYTILDYTSLFFNNTEYFYDGDHLCYTGAEIISKRINSDLNNLFNNEAAGQT